MGTRVWEHLNLRGDRAVCQAGRGRGRSAGLARVVRERVRELSKAGMPGMDTAASFFPGKTPHQGLSATEMMREGKTSSLDRKVLHNKVAISQRCT